MHKIVVYHKSRRGSTKPLIFLHSAVTAKAVFRFLEQQMLSIPSLFSCINFICSEYLFGICSVERILKRKSNFWRWCIFIPSAAQQNFTAGVSDYCTSSAVNLELEIVVFLRIIIWKQCRRKQSEVKWEAFHIWLRPGPVPLLVIVGPGCALWFAATVKLPDSKMRAGHFWQQ